MSQSLSCSLENLVVGLLADPSIVINTMVTGISCDSREVNADSLFVAIAKDSVQRAAHIQQAIEAKCAVIVFEEQHPLTEQECEAVKLAQISALPINNLNHKVSEIAARFYGHPSLALTIIAVTGTNGKTSVCQFVAQALESLSLTCGVIGTLGVGRINTLLNTGMTTPDPVVIQRTLYDFCQQGIHYAVIEASSHALVQGRLNCVAVDVAAFTNLSRDHLDYHQTMEAYAAAKSILFDFMSIKTAVINSNDDLGQQLITTLSAKDNLNIVSYSSNQDDVNAHFKAENSQMVARGIRFNLASKLGLTKIESPLLGRFNIDNLLATMACLDALDLALDLEQLSKLIQQCTAVDGRMDVINSANMSDDDCQVVIDFAHTPDALGQALTSLKEHLKDDGVLWCVFGCGGDRDTGKRSLMGAAAERYADHIVLTDDNPRKEQAELIISDILSGIENPEKVVIKHDRKLAITHAIASANAKDIVLIAGKGHEDYQDVAGVKTPFNDKQVVTEVLAENMVENKAEGMLCPLSQLASVLGCEFNSANDTLVTGAQIDSRKVEAGTLFIALQGEHVDGHDYIKAARLAGASAALVSVQQDDELPQLVVADVAKAFAQIAQYWQQQCQAIVIAVTGSNGKTTVKEMLGSILSQCGSVIATQGNLNNELGVPLTLCRLAKTTHYAVIEMGASQSGDIAQLVEIAQPHISLINNVAPAHIEGFNSLEGVAKAKAEIYAGLAQNGIGIVNVDMPFVEQWMQELATRHVITFSLTAEADITAQNVQCDPLSSHFMVERDGEFNFINLPLAGQHNVENALAAIAISTALQIPVSAIEKGLAGMTAIPHRLQLRRGLHQSHILDDSYNANPGSYQQALAALAAHTGQHWLVLGDFGELGTDSIQHHKQMGLDAKASGVSRLWTIGDESRYASEAYGEGAKHVNSMTELTKELDAILTSDVVCLIKGSRFMQLDKLADTLSAVGES